MNWFRRNYKTGRLSELEAQKKKKKKSNPLTDHEDALEVTELHLF